MIAHRRTNFRRQPSGRNPRVMVIDSIGPSGARVRGNPSQVIGKYDALAQDALASGNTVLAQSYLQHADHYRRIHLSREGGASTSRDSSRDSSHDPSREHSRDSSRNSSPGMSMGSSRNQLSKRSNGPVPRQPAAPAIRITINEEHSATGNVDPDEPSQEAIDSSDTLPLPPEIITSNPDSNPDDGDGRDGNDGSGDGNDEQALVNKPGTTAGTPTSTPTRTPRRRRFQ